MTMTRWILVLAMACGTFAAATVDSQYDCLYEDEECVSIHECSYIKPAINEIPMRLGVVKLLRKLHCAFDGFTPYICCSNKISSELELMKVPRIDLPTSLPIRTDTMTSPTPPLEIDNSILPDKDCGPDYESNKILNGEVTDLDEFPWMVLLGYRRVNGTVTFECGGFLINHRYIMTAAHCVTGAIVRQVGPLVTVRVGEYDLRTERDCLNGNEMNDCAPPSKNIGVEEIIPHEGFVSNRVNREDDIAIVRLSENVEYNFFVQPLCLPQKVQPMEIGERFFVSGWGRTLTGAKSDVKLKLLVPNFNKTACDEVYGSVRARLTPKQLCAGGRRDEDSCRGDSGGPLMRLSAEDDRWYAVGVVSFGNGCGQQGWPGVYTSVPHYAQWLRQKLRP